MPIIASEGEKKEFAPVPAGTFQGVCFDIWDIGFQESEYQGKKNVQHKVILAFEINELISEGEYAGKRMTINKFYTLSLSEKANLRKDLEGWRSKAFTEDELRGFDIEKLVGVNCMLNIIHTEKGKAKISGISKLMNGLAPLSPENPRSTPAWLKTFIDKAVPNPYASEDTDESIPF